MISHKNVGSSILDQQVYIIYCFSFGFCIFFQASQNFMYDNIEYSVVRLITILYQCSIAVILLNEHIACFLQSNCDVLSHRLQNEKWQAKIKVNFHSR